MGSLSLNSYVFYQDINYIKPTPLSIVYRLDGPPTREGTYFYRCRVIMVIFGELVADEKVHVYHRVHFKVDGTN